MKKTLLSFLVCICMIGVTFNVTDPIGMNASINPQIQNSENETLHTQMAWPGLVAAAVGAAYGTGYAIGTVARHAYDRFLIDSATNVQLAMYDANDFSKFDN